MILAASSVAARDAPLVRQWCASQTGNNRIQPDPIRLEQAESRSGRAPD